MKVNVRRAAALLSLLPGIAVGLGVPPAGLAAPKNLTVQVSVSDGATANGPHDAYVRGIAIDGSRVVFATQESLVAQDEDGEVDIYTRSDGVTTLVTTSATAGNGDHETSFMGMSPHGSRIFFRTSEAMVAGDEDTQWDFFERFGSVTTQLTAGETGDDDDGPFVPNRVGINPSGTAFYFSTAEALVAADDDHEEDVYRRAGGVTALMTGGPGFGQGSEDVVNPALSDDGNVLFFHTEESLVEGDPVGTSDIYKNQGGTVSLVTAGVADTVPEFVGASPDGSRVYFRTAARIGPDSDDSFDIFEVFNGTTSQVSLGTINGNLATDAEFHGVSADGSRVFFTTAESLLPVDTDDGGDGNGARDVYMRSAGITTILSDGGADAVDADATFRFYSESSGSVLFETREAFGGDSDQSIDLYRNLGGAITRVSAGEKNGQGASDVEFAAASTDGSRVFFMTTEQLTSFDQDSSWDLYERANGITDLISVGGNGAFDINEPSTIKVNPTGDYVAFESREPLAFQGDADDDHGDVYVRSRASVSFQAATSSAGESDAPTVTITLATAQLRSVAVAFEVTGGTATVADYALEDGLIEIPAGRISVPLPLTLVNDAMSEPDETIVISLVESDVADVVQPALHTLTIEDDDARLRFAVSTSSRTEQASTAVVRVNLIPAAHHATSVQYAVVAGSAVNGRDFTLATGTLRFPAGATSRDIRARILEDFAVEPNETVRIRLSRPVGARLGTPITHTFTIVSDDKGTCMGRPATLAGTARADAIVGTSGNDVIAGKGGADAIEGRGGKDLICAGGGNDAVAGGPGDDSLRGEGGRDDLAGGGGRDSLSGGSGAGDRCLGGAGVDVLAASHGCETVAGVP